MSRFDLDALEADYAEASAPIRRGKSRPASADAPMHAPAPGPTGSNGAPATDAASSTRQRPDKSLESTSPTEVRPEMKPGRRELLQRRGEQELTIRLPARLLEGIESLQAEAARDHGERIPRERVIAAALTALAKDDRTVLRQARATPRGCGGLQKVALTLPQHLISRAQHLAQGSARPEHGGVRVTVTAIVTAAIEQHLPRARRQHGAPRARSIPS